MIKKTLKKWFTLVELIIVIIIIWVLMLWLLPKMSFWNIFKETSLKANKYAQTMVSIWNSDWDLWNFSKQIFGSTNWMAQETPVKFQKDILASISSNNTTPTNSTDAKNMYDDLFSIFASKCSKIEVKHFPDASAYITSSLWKSEKFNTFTTNTTVDWIDTICTLKSPIKGMKTFHLIWFSSPITLSRSDGVKVNTEKLSLIWN